MLRKIWFLSLLLMPLSTFIFIPINTEVKPISFFSVFLLFLLITIFQTRKLSIFKAREVLILIIFIIYLIFQSIFLFVFKQDYSFFNSAKTLISLFVGFIFYVTFRIMNLSKSDYIFSEKIILLAISISVFFAIFQFLALSYFPSFLYSANLINNFFFGTNLISNDRFSGLSPEPAWLCGQLILLMIPLTLSRILSKESLGYIFSYRNRGIIKIEFLYFLIGIIGVIISGSRTGIFGLILIFLFSAFTLIKVNKLNLTFIFFIPIVFTIILLSFFNSYNQAVINALSEYNSFVNFSNMANFAPRYSLFVASVDIFKENLFFGIGAGQFGFYYPKYVQEWALSSPEVLRWIDSDNANPKNFILRLCVEFGIFGTLIFLYFLFLHFNKNCLDLRYKIMRSSIFAAVICYFFEGDSFALPYLWLSLVFLVLYFE